MVDLVLCREQFVKRHCQADSAAEHILSGIYRLASMVVDVDRAIEVVGRGKRRAAYAAVEPQIHRVGQSVAADACAACRALG